MHYVKHELNFIMKLNIPRSQGIGGQGLSPCWAIFYYYEKSPTVITRNKLKQFQSQFQFTHKWNWKFNYKSSTSKNKLWLQFSRLYLILAQFRVTIPKLEVNYWLTLGLGFFFPIFLYYGSMHKCG